MTLDLITLLLCGVATGFLLHSYLRDRTIWRLFVFLVVVFASVTFMTSALIRVETEKTKARLDQVKEIERAMEAK
jgi:uncharacterized membrane protein YfcA